MFSILSALLTGATIGLLIVGAKRLVQKLIQRTKPIVIGKKQVQSRPLWLDVDPTPLKAVDFLEGSIECRLVVFGPFNGNAKRMLLLWKNQKCRFIRMSDVGELNPTMMDDLYRASILEGREIAIKVFQKRKAKSDKAKEQAPLIPAATREPQVREPMQPIEVVKASADKPPNPPKAAPQPSPDTGQSDIPIIKGFKAQYVGKMVAAKVEPHIKTARDGSSEEYTSYTMTLDTEAGVERLVGNDLKRAIAAANVEEGDMVRVLYLRDLDLPNGFKKKSYQIVNLSKQKEWRS